MLTFNQFITDHFHYIACRYIYFPRSMQSKPLYFHPRRCNLSSQTHNAENILTHTCIPQTEQRKCAQRSGNKKVRTTVCKTLIYKKIVSILIKKTNLTKIDNNMTKPVRLNILCLAQRRLSPVFVGVLNTLKFNYSPFFILYHYERLNIVPFYIFVVHVVFQITQQRIDKRTRTLLVGLCNLVYRICLPPLLSLVLFCISDKDNYIVFIVY